jgi:hypothetical protein
MKAVFEKQASTGRRLVEKDVAKVFFNTEAM